MRVKNSLINISVSVLSQVIIALLGFISRKVFIDNLGVEYLGVNGLLTNVLTMLSLVEGGIGVSIVYNLYKPLAEDNKEEVIALVQLYKKLYTILAIIILGLSLVLLPFVPRLIGEGDTIPYLKLVYVLFVIKNIMSYVNAHKWSLISADQKEYVITRVSLVFNIITTISKIFILFYTQDYILYLMAEILIFIIQNLVNGRIVTKKYPYIKSKEKYRVNKETERNLIKNVKAIFLHNVGGYCVFGTDNILISLFVNIKAVGLYSNYTMIIAQLSSVVGPILNGVGASIGNLLATEDEDKSYDIFNVLYFVNFCIYSFCTICLYNLLEPFIEWWIGKGFLLDSTTFIFILINFYLTGLRSSITIFKNKAGIFDQDKFVPIFEAIINLVFSVILVKYLGLAGIFIGTTISTISIPLWNQPRLVYKEVFNRPLSEYFKKYSTYMIFTIVACVLTRSICNLFIVKQLFINLIWRGIVSSITTILLIYVFFGKSKEFKYIYRLICGIFKRVLKRKSEG